MQKVLNLSKVILALFLILPGSCLPFIYHERSKALVEGIKMQDTLKIAEIELAEGGFDAVLTLWAIRDQKITENEAKRVSELYFEYINQLDSEFGIWHLAWAISNLYRLGPTPVKEVLKEAYLDAKKRPETLDRFKKAAKLHVLGEELHMGFAHHLGRSYARQHIIVPGNRHFISSFEEYRKEKIKKIDEENKTEAWVKKLLDDTEQ